MVNGVEESIFAIYFLKNINSNGLGDKSHVSVGCQIQLFTTLGS